MVPLRREEYNAAYYGDDPAGHHPAGYSLPYARVVHAGGEYFADLAGAIRQRVDVRGKTVLELGCAMGYLLADLRRLGAFALGVDWSGYAAYDRPDPEAAGHIHVEEARAYLQRPEVPRYDLLVSRWFLECFLPDDIPHLVRLMNRKADRQIHTLSYLPNDRWYLNRPLNWWATRGFAPGTVLMVWQADRVTEEVVVA